MQVEMVSADATLSERQQLEQHQLLEHQKQLQLQQQLQFQQQQQQQAQAAQAQVQVQAQDQAQAQAQALAQQQAQALAQQQAQAQRLAQLAQQHAQQQAQQAQAQVPQQQQQQVRQPQQATARRKFNLDDFRIHRTLGTGSFGRVHLVQSRFNSRFYAMKVLKKTEIVRLKQVEHTNNEKMILERVEHPFVINLWGTFHDTRNLYMVMDYVVGGELFSVLRKSQALLEDAGSSSPRGYQKPSRRENMMYSNTKFIEQEAQQQQILMQEQDQQLDGVMHTVLNMREIATVMNDELQDQSILLDDLDEHVDRTSGRLQKTMKRMNKFIKDNEETKSTCCIGILIVVLIILLILVIVV
ncbi:camp-dependent protein kinase catalytic subunit [Podila minutissima]|uniref:t-SNARE affecting a late Golgi compartment protein 1 n=1 Tax=Podila minutissima TaxID=64525 RepID=A0A9P5VJ81_9FUNG|nr:camp-dependent protein kinase catalytic subunit [Podila minutissima]